MNTKLTSNLPEDQAPSAYNLDKLEHSPEERLDIEDELRLKNIECAAFLTAKKTPDSLDLLDPPPYWQRLEDTGNKLKSLKTRKIYYYLNLVPPYYPPKFIEEFGEDFQYLLSEASLNTFWNRTYVTKNQENIFKNIGESISYLDGPLLSIIEKRGPYGTSGEQYFKIAMAEIRLNALISQKVFGTVDSYLKSLKQALKEAIVSLLLKENMPIPSNLRFGISKEKYAELLERSKNNLGEVLSRIYQEEDEKKERLEMVRGGVHQKIIDRIAATKYQAFENDVKENKATSSNKRKIFLEKFLQQFPNPEDIIDILIDPSIKV